MDMKPVNNKNYFMAWNDDYRKGGIYHLLSNSEFRLITILQAYCDGLGVVGRGNGKGYDYKELCEMMSMDYKTLKKGLMILENNGLVRIDGDNNIRLNGFVYNHTDRKGTNKATARQRAIYKNQARQEEKDSTTMKLKESVDNLPGMIAESVRTVLTEVYKDNGSVVGDSNE